MTRSGAFRGSSRGLRSGARAHMDKPIYVAPSEVWIKSSESCSSWCRGCCLNGKGHGFCFLRLLCELLIDKALSGLSKATGGCLEISWCEGTAQPPALIFTKLCLQEHKRLPNNEKMALGKLRLQGNLLLQSVRSISSKNPFFLLISFLILRRSWFRRLKLVREM